MNMERVKTHIALFAVLSLFLGPLFSCNPKPQEKGFSVKIRAKEGSLSYYIIRCDSFDMKSHNEIDIWANGRKNKVFAIEIALYTFAY